MRHRKTDQKPLGTTGTLASISKFLGRYTRFTHVLFLAVLSLSAVSFWLSYDLRFDFNVPSSFSDQRVLLLPYVAGLKLLLFLLLRGHSTNWRYVGTRDLPGLLAHCALGSILLLATRFLETPLII
ncbi:hypothetical protein ACFL2Q_20010, partial [Thermodesulfobacteriota bacterium]